MIPRVRGIHDLFIYLFIYRDYGAEFEYGHNQQKKKWCGPVMWLNINLLLLTGFFMILPDDSFPPRSPTSLIMSYFKN